MNNNKQVAIISVVSNGFLTSLKLIFGIITGSVSLLSEALHSFGDLLASLIAWGSIMESSKPADKEHQFGHGKFEDMAGFIEAILIIVTALFILYVGFEKIKKKNLEYTFEADIAVYIMIFSVVVNYIVAKYLLKKGHQTDSNALLGDGYHLMSDVYSSLAVAIGLLAVKFSGHYILDPVIAIIVAVMILKTGIGLIRKTGDNLLDSSLPNEDIAIIENVLNNHKDKNLGIKTIKTSKSGNIKNIVLIIYLPCNMTLKETHRLCDKIEAELEEKLKHTNVIIHAEPDCKCLKKENCPALIK